jgi:hypothetical protein
VSSICSPTNATRRAESYRRFEEGRLSDEQLLETVSYELTGSFVEGERYKEAVEGCVRTLKEEEGIA